MRCVMDHDMDHGKASNVYIYTLWIAMAANKIVQCMRIKRSNKVCIVYLDDRCHKRINSECNLDDCHQMPHNVISIYDVPLYTLPICSIAHIAPERLAPNGRECDVENIVLHSKYTILPMPMCSPSSSRHSFAYITNISLGFASEGMSNACNGSGGRGMRTPHLFTNKSSRDLWVLAYMSEKPQLAEPYTWFTSRPALPTRMRNAPTHTEKKECFVRF